MSEAESELKNKLEIGTEFTPDVTPGFKPGVIPEVTTEFSGHNLLETLVSLTGLPSHLVYEELDGILARTGCARGEQLTLDDLRTAMLSYLETVNCASESTSVATTARIHDDEVC